MSYGQKRDRNRNYGDTNNNSSKPSSSPTPLSTSLGDRLDNDAKRNQSRLNNLLQPQQSTKGQNQSTTSKESQHNTPRTPVKSHLKSITTQLHTPGQNSTKQTKSPSSSTLTKKPFNNNAKMTSPSKPLSFTPSKHPKSNTTASETPSKAHKVHSTPAKLSPITSSTPLKKSAASGSNDNVNNSSQLTNSTKSNHTISTVDGVKKSNHIISTADGVKKWVSKLERLSPIDYAQTALHSISLLPNNRVVTMLKLISNTKSIKYAKEMQRIRSEALFEQAAIAKKDFHLIIHDQLTPAEKEQMKEQDKQFALLKQNAISRLSLIFARHRNNTITLAQARERYNRIPQIDKYQHHISSHEQLTLSFLPPSKREKLVNQLISERREKLSPNDIAVLCGKDGKPRVISRNPLNELAPVEFRPVEASSKSKTKDEFTTLAMHDNLPPAGYMVPFSKEQSAEYTAEFSRLSQQNEAIIEGHKRKYSEQVDKLKKNLINLKNRLNNAKNDDIRQETSQLIDKEISTKGHFLQTSVDEIDWVEKLRLPVPLGARKRLQLTTKYFPHYPIRKNFAEIKIRSTYDLDHRNEYDNQCVLDASAASSTTTSTTTLTTPTTASTSTTASKKASIKNKIISVPPEKFEKLSNHFLNTTLKYQILRNRVQRTHYYEKLLAAEAAFNETADQVELEIQEHSLLEYNEWLGRQLAWNEVELGIGIYSNYYMDQIVQKYHPDLLENRIHEWIPEWFDDSWFPDADHVQQQSTNVIKSRQLQSSHKKASLQLKENKKTCHKEEAILLSSDDDDDDREINSDQSDVIEEDQEEDIDETDLPTLPIRSTAEDWAKYKQYKSQIICPPPPPCHNLLGEATSTQMQSEKLHLRCEQWIEELKHLPPLGKDNDKRSKILHAYMQPIWDSPLDNEFPDDGEREWKYFHSTQKKRHNIISQLYSLLEQLKSCPRNTYSIQFTTKDKIVIHPQENLPHKFSSIVDQINQLSTSINGWKDEDDQFHQQMHLSRVNHRKELYRRYKTNKMNFPSQEPQNVLKRREMNMKLQYLVEHSDAFRNTSIADRVKAIPRKSRGQVGWRLQADAYKTLELEGVAPHLMATAAHSQMSEQDFYQVTPHPQCIPDKKAVSSIHQYMKVRILNGIEQGASLVDKISRLYYTLVPKLTFQILQLILRRRAMQQLFNHFSTTSAGDVSILTTLKTAENTFHRFYQGLILRWVIVRHKLDPKISQSGLIAKIHQTFPTQGPSTSTIDETPFDFDSTHTTAIQSTVEDMVRYQFTCPLINQEKMDAINTTLKLLDNEADHFPEFSTPEFQQIILYSATPPTPKSLEFVLVKLYSTIVGKNLNQSTRLYEFDLEMDRIQQLTTEEDIFKEFNLPSISRITNQVRDILSGFISPWKQCYDEYLEKKSKHPQSIPSTTTVIFSNQHPIYPPLSATIHPYESRLQPISQLDSNVIKVQSKCTEPDWFYYHDLYIPQNPHVTGDIEFTTNKLFLSQSMIDLDPQQLQLIRSTTTISPQLTDLDHIGSLLGLPRIQAHLPSAIPPAQTIAIAGNNPKDLVIEDSDNSTTHKLNNRMNDDSDADEDDDEDLEANFDEDDEVNETSDLSDDEYDEDDELNEDNQTQQVIDIEMGLNLNEKKIISSSTTTNSTLNSLVSNTGKQFGQLTQSKLTISPHSINKKAKLDPFIDRFAAHRIDNYFHLNDDHAFPDFESFLLPLRNYNEYQDAAFDINQYTNNRVCVTENTLDVEFYKEEILFPEGRELQILRQYPLPHFDHHKGDSNLLATKGVIPNKNYLGTLSQVLTPIPPTDREIKKKLVLKNKLIGQDFQEYFDYTLYDDAITAQSNLWLMRSNFTHIEHNTLGLAKILALSAETIQLENEFHSSISSEINTPNLFDTFRHSEISEEIYSSIQAQNVSKPTPFQATALPVLFSGQNLFAIAPSDSGKMFSYLLPAILHRNAQPPTKPGQGPVVLFISATAHGVESLHKEIVKFTSALHINVATLGSTLETTPEQNRANLVHKPIDILIATPQILLDFVAKNQHHFALARVSYIVLDRPEKAINIADYKLHVEILSQRIHPDAQLSIFCSELNAEVEKFTHKFFSTSPHTIIVPQRQTFTQIASKVNIKFTLTPYGSDEITHTTTMLQEFYADPEEFHRTIVFVPNDQAGIEIIQKLRLASIPCSILSPSLDAKIRHQIAQDFTQDKFRVLVTTDLMAHGLHFSDIKYAMNVGIPDSIDTYVKRLTYFASSSSSKSSYHGTMLDIMAPTHPPVRMSQILDMYVYLHKPVSLALYTCTYNSDGILRSPVISRQLYDELHKITQQAKEHHARSTSGIEAVSDQIAAQEEEQAQQESQRRTLSSQIAKGEKTDRVAFTQLQKQTIEQVRQKTASKRWALRESQFKPKKIGDFGHVTSNNPNFVSKKNKK